MKHIFAIRGAKAIVEICASIKEGEHVLIVTDFDTLKSAQIIAGAVLANNADVEMVVMTPRELDGNEPPLSTRAAMEKSEVILMPVSKSLAHTEATKSALINGSRILSLTATSEELLSSDAYKADFKKQQPICEKVAQLFTNANDVVITSLAGTTLRTSAEGRKGNAHSAIVDKPGQFSAAPSIEASFSPVENSMEGIFVADASIPYLGIGLLSTPIKFTIKDGRIIKTEGSNEAKKITKIWSEQYDPNVYNIAQVAIGLNPEIKAPIGVLGCNYDEGAFGIIHIGIGTSSNIGGKIKASTHFDAVMNKPTMKLDGKIILDNGKLII